MLNNKLNLLWKFRQIRKKIALKLKWDRKSSWNTRPGLVNDPVLKMKAEVHQEWLSVEIKVEIHHEWLVVGIKVESCPVWLCVGNKVETHNEWLFFLGNMYRNYFYFKRINSSIILPKWVTTMAVNYDSVLILSWTSIF